MKGRKDSDFYEVKVKLTDPDTLGDLEELWSLGYFRSLTRMYDAALEVGLDVMRERRGSGASVYDGDIAERDRETLYALIAGEYSDMRADAERTRLLVNSVVNAMGTPLPVDEKRELYESGALSCDPFRAGTLRGEKR